MLSRPLDSILISSDGRPLQPTFLCSLFLFLPLESGEEKSRFSLYHLILVARRRGGTPRFVFIAMNEDFAPLHTRSLARPGRSLSGLHLSRIERRLLPSFPSSASSKEMGKVKRGALIAPAPLITSAPAMTLAH